jgi:hypothetical protein
LKIFTKAKLHLAVSFNDVLLQKYMNGGTLQFGYMQKVINNYNSMGFNKVTCLNLCYRLKVHEKTGCAVLVSEMKTPAQHVVTGTDAPISDLTEEHASPPVNNEADASEEQVQVINNDDNNK